MRLLSRSPGVLSGLVTLTAALVLVWFTQSPGLSRISSGQDEKGVISPPAKDEGSDDRKDEQAEGLHRFMRQKMEASSLILEGLCTDDLKSVADGSQTLLKMPSEAKWRVSNDIMYRRYSTEFLHAVEELQKEAESNDIDGASMAWVNVTMKCLKCHKWVRNPVIAESEK
jgi:hypothetical protein